MNKDMEMIKDLARRSHLLQLKMREELNQRCDKLSGKQIISATSDKSQYRYIDDLPLTWEELQENAQIDLKRREQPKLYSANADISRQQQPLISHEGQTTISMFSVKHDPDDSIESVSSDKKSLPLLALKKVVEEREAELRQRTNTILTEC